MPIPLGNEILQVPDDAWDILRDCRVFFLKQLVRLLQEAEPALKTGRRHEQLRWGYDHLNRGNLPEG
jgi:hypothetical protein